MIDKNDFDREVEWLAIPLEFREENLEPGKFGASVVKKALKSEYCIRDYRE